MSQTQRNACSSLGASSVHIAGKPVLEEVISEINGTTFTTLLSSNPYDLEANDSFHSSKMKKVAMEQLKSVIWTQLAPMQSQREGGAAVAIMGSKILVVGGYHAEHKFLKSCAMFDVSTNEWSEYPPMKTARMGCAAVYLEQHNAVVVVGGFQRGRKYLDTAEYLDLSTLHWHRLPPMQNPRAGCAAVTVLGKRVVVLGGWMDGENASGTVEILDFSAQQWHSLPEMATPRAGCSASALGHRVFVLGGHTTSGNQRGCRSSVEVLDLSNQKWSRMPSMKEKRDASASCVIGNCIVVLGGGESSTSPSASVEILDVEKQAWKEVPKMTSKRFGCSAAAVGNKIIVIGGRGKDGKHLESVECLELPMESENGVSLGNFLDLNQSPPSRNEANGDLISLANTISSMLEQDRVRIKSTYESSKKQAQDMFDRTVTSLEERLRIIDKEREKILEQMKQARKEREESVAKAEKERRDAISRLDSKLQKNKAQLSMNPTSAPEYLVSNDADELEPPSELCCCITGDLMDDPVTAMDGHTYERSAIEAWFSRFNETQRPTSPLTNEPLPSRRLIPSHNIRSQCKTWKEKLGIANEPEVADPLANIVAAGGSNNREKARHPSPARRGPRQVENRSRSLEISGHSVSRPRSSTSTPSRPTLERRSSAGDRVASSNQSSRRVTASRQLSTRQEMLSNRSGEVGL